MAPKDAGMSRCLLKTAVSGMSPSLRQTQQGLQEAVMGESGKMTPPPTDKIVLILGRKGCIESSNVKL